MSSEDVKSLFYEVYNDSWNDVKIDIWADWVGTEKTIFFCSLYIEEALVDFKLLFNI